MSVGTLGAGDQNLSRDNSEQAFDWKGSKSYGTWASRGLEEQLTHHRQA